MQVRQVEEKGPAQSRSSPISLQNIKLGAPGLFARLHAFLPNPLSPGHSPQSNLVQATPAPESAYIKTRIITWNMHDSLPKGNLEDLLGIVPPFTSRSIVDDRDRMALPGLSLEEGHPYHIVVVAGQECPTLSGIPMGITANFKHWDREKEKHRDHGQENDPEKEKSKERHIMHRAESSLKKNTKQDAPHLKDPCPPHKDSDSHSNHHTSHTTSGWSTVLEDWFANGIGSLHGMKPVVMATPIESLTSSDNRNLYDHVGPTSLDDQQLGVIDVNWKAGSPTSNGISPTLKGPYELLVKDRLMGIYIAVFVHRDVRPLVRGVSTDSVPTGLIGGRLGNKGGVGVSVNFNGTSLLFINAHLAAHEDKVSLRVANLAKIKAELSVDAFLPPDDPRALAEDLTEKFDYTWIFGDLNFRLNISRLHADWLISRKEYRQALAFDQLSELLKVNDPTFSGLREADIDFPPTFKYDVQRSRRRSRQDHKVSARYALDEADEDGEDGRQFAFNNKGDEEEDERVDSVSMASSAWTTHTSKLKPGSAESGSDNSPSPSVPKLFHPSSPTKLMSHAARKAKSAWIFLLHASGNKRRSSPLKPKNISSPAIDIPRLSVQLPSRIHSSSVNLIVPAEPKQSTSAGWAVPAEPQQYTSAGTAASTETKGSLSMKPLSQFKEAEGSISESERGVYDSSSKQRVPSWCDRIIWKSTVKSPSNGLLNNPLECEYHMEEHDHVQNRTTRVGLLSNTFRPRYRKEESTPVTHRYPMSTSRSSTVPNGTLSKPSLPASPGLFQTRSLDHSSKSLSAENIPHNDFDRSRSVSASVVGGGKARRRLSLPPSSPHLPTIADRLHIPQDVESDRPSAVASLPPPSPVVSSAIGASKRWFQNFLGRDSVQSVTDAGLSSDTVLQRHRRGDVVAISYHSLDDRQMRQLEGHSDHRPVIGSYAIYI